MGRKYGNRYKRFKENWRIEKIILLPHYFINNEDAIAASVKKIELLKINIISLFLKAHLHHNLKPYKFFQLYRI